MPYSLSREFGFVIWGLLLGEVRDREAANAGVASAPGIRQRFGGSTAQPPAPGRERRGGAHSRLSRIVVSEVSEEVTAPSLGTRPSRPCRKAGAGAELVAAAAGRTGPEGRSPRAGPLPLPFPSVGPMAGRWSAPGGGLGAYGRRAGVLALAGAGRMKGALLLRHVWSWRGARRARSKHSVDGHETGWAGVRWEPAARGSLIMFAAGMTRRSRIGLHS